MGTNPVDNIAGTALPRVQEKSAIDKQEIQRLAQQFEAMLMTQMLREMRRSMVDEEEDQEDGFGASAMTDTSDIALGNALSSAGGLGLADALLNAFERQIAPQREAVTRIEIARTSAEPDATTIAGPVPRRLETSTLLPTDITAAASVSSGFGWRQDPLTGAPRFHQGIDLAVAYGQDVKAATAGKVAFAGVQNGYGTTVVIDHALGRQTRYAHLSEALVRAGDVVAEGQVVGRSGNSGRSTGPHLHFELRVDGRPVAPTHTIAE